MANYRFLAYDLRTNVALDELPLSVKKFGDNLDGSGEFEADLPIEAATASLRMAATVPERTAIFVERDGVLMQGYVLWRRVRSLEAPMKLWGMSFPSFLRRQRIVADLAYAGVDQLTIARGLITHMQSQAGGNIGINVGSGVSGVLRAHTYYGYERKNIGDALSELAELDLGFNWAIDVAWSGGVPAKNLTLSYPRRGRIAGSTGIVFESGKNLTGYTFTEDGTRSARAVDVLGSGDGKDMKISTAVDTALIDAGYPLTAEVMARKDESVVATLDAMAIAAVRARAATPTFLSIAVQPDDVDGGLGTWIVGDDALVRITDQNFPARSDGTPGYQAYHRIVGYEVDIPDAGPETVNITLGAIAS